MLEEEHMVNKKIIALVITYNDRSIFLENALRSLLNQTVPFDKIFIVNNGSVPKTEAVIKKYLSSKIECLTFKKNIGSAIFHEAIKIITEKEDFSWLYLVDDDGQLKKDTLEKLISSSCFSKQTAMLSSLRLDNQGNIEQRGFFNFFSFSVKSITWADCNQEQLEIGHSSFMGMLINKEAIKQIGYPSKDYFLYLEDVEYSLRLAKFGKIYLVPKSIIIHTEPAQTRSKKVRLFILTVPRTRINEAWRDYYSIRNLFLLIRDLPIKFRFLYLIIFYKFIKSFWAIIFLDDYRIRRINLLLKAVYDGLINRRGEVIDSISYQKTIPKPSILFITMGRNEPASRFRVQQFLPFMKTKGYKYLVWPLHLGKYSLNVYRRSRLFWSMVIVFMKIFSIFLVPFYDIIFIQRSVIKKISPSIEKLLYFFNKNIIFDFDDAIWLKYQKINNPIAQIITLSQMIIAGNRYLADYAREYNDQITVIPTAIDTDNYYPKKQHHKKFIIGWSGTKVNLDYLYQLNDSLFDKVRIEFPQAMLLILCDEQPQKVIKMNYEYIQWQPDIENEVINRFDVGLMPLADDAWTKGKCSFKALQYMSCGVVPVISAVGMNKEIIDDQKDGFLINSEEEWFLTVKKLIKDEKLRAAVGNNARNKVIENYSVAKLFNKWEKAINSVL